LKKSTRVTVGIAIVFAALAAYLGYRAIDVVVVYAFEHYGPDILGVPVKVHGAHISVFDGEGSVRGLDIGSPPGFTAARTARVGDIRVSLEPSTLKGPVVHVRELSVADAAITYERGDAASNVDAILAHVRRYVETQGKAGEGKGASAAAPRHRYIVDHLAIRNVRVTVTVPALRGQGITFDLPEVELRDVGRREGGMTSGEIAATVGNTLERKIAQKMLTRLDLLRQGGVGGALDALRGLIPR
jgi:hypothetical protein